MAGGVFVYRYPTARATTVIGVAAVVAAVLASLFIPSRDVASLPPLVAAAA